MLAVPVYKLSPLYRRLRDSGVTWSNTGAWRTVATFSAPETELRVLGSGVGLCDLSHYVKLEFRGRDIERILPVLLGIGALPAPGSGQVVSSRIAYRFTHEELLLCSADEDAVTGSIGSDSCVHATDRTSGLACFLIAGPRSVDVLNRLSSLDLGDASFPDFACARAPFAHVNAGVARRDRKQLRAYEIFIGREYGEYVWEAIWDAGEQFGITGFGLNALSTLER